MSENTETESAVDRRTGPRDRYTVDDTAGLIIRKSGEITNNYPVNDLLSVRDSFTVELAIRYLRQGFTWEQICAGDLVPSRIAIPEVAPKPAKVAKVSNGHNPSIHAIAQVRGTDVSSTATWFAGLTKEEKALVRAQPAVVYARAQITGKIKSLDEVLAAAPAPAVAVGLEQAAD